MKIPDLREIAVAWARSMNPSDEVQLRADARLLKCDACPMKTFKKSVHAYFCSGCGCPIQKKIYSPKGAEACPLRSWDE